MPQDTLNLGLWDRVSRGYKMTKLGMRVIRADPELMIYTLISLILSVGVALLVLSGTLGLSALVPETTDAASNSNEEDAFAVATLTLAFLGYMAISIVTVFWNSAIIASAYERLSSGSNPSFSFGIKKASECLPSIFIWGIISGTVGLFLKILEGISENEKSPIAFFAMFIHFILGAAWWALTFFVVPMMVLDKHGVFDSLQSSPKLFSDTWGENIGATGGVGVIQFLSTLLCISICIPLFFLGDYGVIFGIVLILFLIGLISLFFVTVDSVNRASLYYYAKTGEMPPMAEKMGIVF
ncbi:MAG: hypothetical protein CMO38_07500 [Verrucomicrobiaceae bacterium]|nr:hypothetical protein [Verrucomicrobiaceae bacterium]MBD29075.1 hypothetical protein [Verrucomicrobiaceae bacterium]